METLAFDRPFVRVSPNFLDSVGQMAFRFLVANSFKVHFLHFGLHLGDSYLKLPCEHYTFSEPCQLSLPSAWTGVIFYRCFVAFGIMYYTIKLSGL